MVCTSVCEHVAQALSSHTRFAGWGNCYRFALLTKHRASVLVFPQGFLVCRYLFVRCDSEPAPWSSEGGCRQLEAAGCTANAPLLPLAVGMAC